MEALTLKVSYAAVDFGPASNTVNCSCMKLESLGGII
jgi:hypothetical protein